jgi:hypothetical protein
MTLSIGFRGMVRPMRPTTPVMNDPWGELSRLSFDERCRCT